MTVDELLAQYTLPDDERKRLMMGNALLGLGMGLASSRRGNELSGLTQGLFAGTQAGAQQYGDAQRGQMDRLKLREHLQGVIDKQEAAKQALADQQQVGAIFSGGPQLQNMGPGGPTPQNAAAVAPPDQVTKYRKAAEFYASKGNVEHAAKLSAIADKLEEEWSTTPQVGMNNGQAVNALISKRGNVKPLPDFAPTPKFREVQRGGSVDIVNDYNLPTTGASYAKTLTPEGVQSGQQWQADYAIRKAAEQRAVAAANQAKEVKPQWDSTSGSFVYPPSADAPQGKAVQPQGYTPKQERPSDQQLATGGFLDRMQFASKYIDALEKKGYEPGAGQAAVSALSKVPLVGGVLGYAAESGQNWAAPESAAYKNAQEAWIRAKLRKESGAVIGVDEMEGERKTFFPQPNDPPEVRKQKAELRKQVEQSMIKQARGGFQGGPAQEDPLGLR